MMLDTIQLGISVLAFAVVGNSIHFNDPKCTHPSIANGKAEPLFRMALPEGEYSDYYVEDTPDGEFGNYDDYDNFTDAEYAEHAELKVQCRPKYSFNETKQSSGIAVCTLVILHGGEKEAVWSPVPETVCSPMLCYPADIPGGVLTATCNDEAELSSPVIIRQTACIRCKLGYEMTDEQRRGENAIEVHCLPDGEWDLPVNCTNSIACQAPPSPQYGDIAVFDPLKEIVFSCHERFLPVGRVHLKCDLGKWIGDPPLCRFRASCMTNELSNGVIDVNPDNVGRGPWAKPNTTATYRCNNGYKSRTHDTSVRCRRGKWSPRPKCILVERCRALKPLLHGSHVALYGQYYSYGSVYRFTCQRGYTFTGSEDGHVVDITCSRNGAWSRDEPKCKILRCPSLLAPRHGKIRKINGKDFLYNSMYAVQCNPHYRLGGRRPGEVLIRRCSAEGQWTGESGVCEARKVFLSREEWASFLTNNMDNCCPPKRELGYEWSPGCPIKSGVMTECIHPPWYKTDSTCYYPEIWEYDMPERVNVWYALLGVKVDMFQNKCCWVSDRLPPYQCYEGPWVWQEDG